MFSLADLDRCEHGRHAVDPCFSCPDGWSTGNLFLRDGQRIGTNHGGDPVVIEQARRHARIGDTRTVPPLPQSSFEGIDLDELSLRLRTPPVAGTFLSDVYREMWQDLSRLGQYLVDRLHDLNRYVECGKCRALVLRDPRSPALPIEAHNQFCFEVGDRDD